MLSNLSKKLNVVIKTLSGNSRLTEENITSVLREIRIALLEADTALPVVRQFIENIKSDIIGSKVDSSLTPGQTVVSIVNTRLTELMGGFNDEINLSVTPPAVLLMAGLQGSGKTTTTCKLAKRLKEINKKKVLLVSADVYRPAAITQLETLAKSIQVDVFPSTISQLPIDIVTAALDHAKRHYYEVLIVDTAGRTTVDEKMMSEIKEIHSFLNPIETLFIVDSMLGQDAVNTAKSFNDALNITGIILTKMDGDSRGGAALSIRYVIGKPIKFIGISEKVDGLEPFYPDRIASRILGMGDLLSLIETVQSNVKEEQVTKMMNKIKKGKKFDLNDFKEQLEQVETMGGLDSLLDKLPGNLSAKIPVTNIDNNITKVNLSILNSMTQKERTYPDLLKASRKRRIALGSGNAVQDVNKMLKMFDQYSDMMKKISSGGMFKMMKSLGNMSNLLK